MAIQIRRGTNAEWESNNSNIEVGEPAIATDEERFFVGTASGDFAEFANLDVIAPAYDNTTSYVVGDIINYHGKLYSCNAPCSGAFNIGYWNETSLTDILKDLANEIDYAQYEIGYASGELIAINNGASEIPVKDLTLDIKAVQDLHGYDHPWVGGAGKNKLQNTATSKTSVGITTTVNADGTVSLSGTASDLFNELIGTIELNAGTTYYISGCPSGGGTTTYELRVRDANYHAYTTDYGTGLSFTVPSDGTYYVAFIIRQGANVSNKLLKPMVCLSTAPNPNTFEPYTNICPISGWDEVNVNVAGKNLLDYDEWKGTSVTRGTAVWENNGVTLTATANDAYTNYYGVFPDIYVKQGITYTLSWESDTSKGGQIYVFFYNANKTNTRNLVDINSKQKITFTANEGEVFIRFRFGVNTSGDTIAYKNVMVTIGDSIPTSYEPYNGQTYAIDLDGTRYGGSLDVTNGVLTVTHGFVDLGTMAYNYTSSYNGVFYANLPSDAKLIVGTAGSMCSNYAQTSGSDWQYLLNGEYILRKELMNLGRCAIAIRDDSYTNATDFKNALTASNAKLVYELATPQVVQLTPTQVRTVLGTNNLWNQMNSNNELAYRISNALN